MIRAYGRDVDQHSAAEWKHVTDRRLARRIIAAYLLRYANKAVAAGDWRTLARVHNGGPRGAEKDATIAYADKVIALMHVEEMKP